MKKDLELLQTGPCFLIATPLLRDPHFHQTVVLLIEYNAEGAFGIVLNRPLDVRLDTVQTNDATIAHAYLHDTLWYGGPVNPNHLLCLYETRGVDLPDDSFITSELALASSGAILNGSEHPAFPGTYRIFAGHAGWVAEQLDQEITAGAWIMAPLKSEIIFSTAPEKFWRAGMDLLKIDPTHYHDAPSQSFN